jgi:gliding motility-associated lipoprotein GldD
MRYLILVFIIGMIGCKEEGVYSPKPRMYPKVDYPEKSYTIFNETYCEMTFERPVYTEVKQEKSFFDEDPLHPCWFDITFPSLNGKLHFSYYPIDSRERFDELVGDAFTFVEKHDIKANYRTEILIENDQGLNGILFDIDGPVASPVQFYLSDSTRHFIRASLYFNNKVEPDSMAPIHAFVKEDIERVIETMKFN